MSKKVEEKGVVTDKGEFKIFNYEFFKGKVINSFKGKNIKIVVEEDKPTASNPQIKYYFGVVVKLIQEHFLESGVKRTQAQIDETLRDNFLFEEEADFVTGEIVHKKMRLNSREIKVTTTRMMEFFADVQQWASQEMDLYIPDPNEEVKNHGLEQSPDNKQ